MNKKISYFRRALGLVRKSAPGWTAANILVSLLKSFLPLLLLFLIKNLVDSLTTAATGSEGIQSPGLLLYIVLIVVIWFADEAASDIGTFIKRKQSVKLESFMYDLLHVKSVRTDLINFEHPAYYDILSRAVREAPWRPNNIVNNLVSLFRSLISLSLMAGVLFSSSILAAVILIMVNIPGIWLKLHFASELYNFHKKQTPEARKAAYFNWILTGDRPSRELRLFGTGSYFRKLFRKSFNKSRDEETEIIRKRTLIELFSDLIKAAAVLAVILFIARQAIRGEVSLGQMTMLLLAFRQGMIYVKELFGSLSGLYEDSLFIGDLFEFLDLKENIVARQPVIQNPTFEKGIRVENLSFTYPGNKHPAISDVTFEVKRGEVVAIVGHNGAGKSTLVRLLARLYEPDSGMIAFDDNDTRNIDPEQLRKILSVMFQDFMLYNLSAGENIRLGDVSSEYSSGRTEEAAGMAGIDNTLSSLRDGYDTLIGNLFDDSRELSWGEWQKIALARTLYRKAPVLILDEPSSALDAESEYEIFSRFREVVSNRTAILISHRFTNVSIADRIIVLDKGSVAESGTHDELMSLKGIYYNMYSRQAERFNK